jgi:hypothetical protein
MGEDIIFKLEDIDIKPESADFISNENTATADNSEPGSPEEANQANQAAEPSVEISETTNTADTVQPGLESQDEQNSNENDAGGEDTSQEDAPSSDDSSQNSTLYALAQYLKEEGVLFIEEDLKDVNSLEDLKDLIKNSNEKAGYANLNETQRRYQDALKNGVPKSEFEKIENEIQTYSNIKEEDVENNPQLRYEILAIDMINDGIEQEKALKLAKLALNDESNIQDAKQALDNIREAKKQKFQSLVEESKKTKDVSINQVKDELFKKEQLFDQKVNDLTKNKLFDLITTEVDRDEEGRGLNELQKWQRDNPVESSIMLNYLYMMTNKGKDLNLIRKSGETKAAKDLEKRLRSTLSFNKDGSLNLPDEMVKGNKQRNNNNNDNILINI